MQLPMIAVVKDSKIVKAFIDPVYMSKKIRKFRTDKFTIREANGNLAHATHVNGHGSQPL